MSNLQITHFPITIFSILRIKSKDKILNIDTKRELTVLSDTIFSA